MADIVARSGIGTGGRLPVSAFAPPGPKMTRTAADARIRVMVVDDNDGFRESLMALLRAGGLDVVGEARNGVEALDVVDTFEPDIVLMDVRMPGMNGVEATRRLKSARPDIGVVALTAQEDERIVREMLVSGASGYVLKDADGDDILNAVSQAAVGGGALSPSVTPAVIDQLKEALAGERRRTQELQEAHAALVDRVRRRHELLSRLGHELRTPVTVILGIARTLGAGASPPDQERDLLDRLVTRATALGRLVERLEAVMEAESEDRLDPHALARQIAEPYPRVRIDVPEPLPEVFASAVLARRILEELIDNACRFSPPEAPVVVTLSGTSSGLEVRVADQGPGIPPEDRARIFEPLEQVEDLDVRTHEGAGMGLSLARAAARAMDGDLVIERTGPDGSTFLWTVGRGLR